MKKGTPAQEWAVEFVRQAVWLDGFTGVAVGEAPASIERQSVRREAERLFWEWVRTHLPEELINRMADLYRPVDEGSSLRALIAERERWAHPTFIGPF